MRRRNLLLAALPVLMPLPMPAQPAELEVNSATQAQLESLPGLGPALVERILAARPFADWRELRERVKGIGPKLARRLSDAGLRVRGAAYPD